ncbi:MAG: cell envelope integrity protein CreD [Pseudomonadota bacterium]
MQKALVWKIALVAAVMLLLQIPIEAIRGLVSERQQRRNGVIAEIARGTAEAQRIAGPVLYVPWTRRSVETTTTKDDVGRERSVSRERVEHGQVAFLPETLSIEGSIELQEKHRSLYKAHLYTLHAVLRGRFTLPAGLGVPRVGGTLVFGQARLVFGIQDPRGIRDGVQLEWGGAPLALRPGGIEAAGLASGIHAELGQPEAAASHDFRILLPLVGTERLEIVPVGAVTSVSLSSKWPHPGFGGRILPEAGTRVSGHGFSARWRTSHFANNLAQLHERCVRSRQCDAFNQHTLALSFVQPVDLYQTVERAVKYGILFIGLTFAAFFLFEVLQRRALHPVQYALVGFALALFFLLLIALAEHLGFALAYAIAASACVALNAYYVAHALQSARRGAGFGIALTALYGLLYVILRAEDHALLMGSVLVFACLALAMIATRGVDWYAFGASPQAGGKPA